jgi:Fe-S-cluster-containing dehydrogenase component
VNREYCIGCHMCVQACPFGVIAVREDGKGVLKCDLCIERLREGQEPACVSSCPTKALLFVEETESNKTKRQRLARQLVVALEESRGKTE